MKCQIADAMPSLLLALRTGNHTLPIVTLVQYQMRRFAKTVKLTENAPFSQVSLTCITVSRTLLSRGLKIANPYCSVTNLAKAMKYQIADVMPSFLLALRTGNHA